MCHVCQSSITSASRYYTLSNSILLEVKSVARNHDYGIQSIVSHKDCHGKVPGWTPRENLMAVSRRRIPLWRVLTFILYRYSNNIKNYVVDNTYDVSTNITWANVTFLHYPCYNAQYHEYIKCHTNLVSVCSYPLSYGVFPWTLRLTIMQFEIEINNYAQLFFTWMSILFLACNRLNACIMAGGY